MRRLLTALACVLLAWTPAAAQVMKLHPAPVVNTVAIAFATGAANVTYSNSNRTATKSGAGGSSVIVFGNISFDATRKIFVEFTATTADNPNIANGVADASGNGYLGSDTHSLGMYLDGTFYLNAGATSAGGSFAGGTNTLILAVDGPNKKAWLYRAGFGATGWAGSSGGAGATDNPVTNTGGKDISTLTFPLFPAVNLASFPTPTDEVTINGGSSPYVNTAVIATLVMAGFTAP